MSDTVFIKNPDLPDARPAQTSREAFDKVWSKKGFKLVNADGSELQDPESLKGKALDDALEAAGLDTGGTAAEKRQRLVDHQAGTLDQPAEA